MHRNVYKARESLRRIIDPSNECMDAKKLCPCPSNPCVLSIEFEEGKYEGGTNSRNVIPAINANSLEMRIERWKRNGDKQDDKGPASP